MVTLCVPSGNADVSSTASHSPEPVLFPEAAGRGAVITVKADGEDEEAAVSDIEKLINAKFDEVE